MFNTMTECDNDKKPNDYFKLGKFRQDVWEGG